MIDIGSQVVEQKELPLVEWARRSEVAVAAGKEHKPYPNLSLLRNRSQKPLGREIASSDNLRQN